MTGRLHLPGQDKAELAAIREWLRATGLNTVADVMERYVAAAGAAVDETGIAARMITRPSTLGQVL